MYMHDDVVVCVNKQVGVQYIVISTLTVPSVVSFITGDDSLCAPPVLVVDVCINLFTAAFCSTDVGGDCIGRYMICPTVNLDGEKVDEVILQPDSM